MLKKSAPTLQNWLQSQHNSTCVNFQWNRDHRLEANAHTSWFKGWNVTCKDGNAQELYCLKLWVASCHQFAQVTSPFTCPPRKPAKWVVLMLSLWAELKESTDCHSRKKLKDSPKLLKCVEAAIIVVVLVRPTCVGTFSDYPPVSHFAFHDMRWAVAGAVIKTVN